MLQISNLVEGEYYYEFGIEGLKILYLSNLCLQLYRRSFFADYYAHCLENG